MNEFGNIDIENFLARAEDFGYTVEDVPNYFKNNNELGRDIFWVSYLAEDADYEDRIATVYSLEDAIDIIKQHSQQFESSLV